MSGKKFKELIFYVQVLPVVLPAFLLDTLGEKCIDASQIIEKKISKPYIKYLKSICEKTEEHFWK